MIMLLKKICINLIIVLCLVAGLDFFIGRLMRYFYFQESSGLHYRTTYALDSTNADVLIFGSSRANHHYVPEVFEDSLKLSFYNTGRDGNGLFYQLAVLKSVLNRYTPKIIIYDYTGAFKKDDSYDKISSLLPYYRTHANMRDIIELKSPYEKIKLISEIYPFNSQILTIAIGNLELNKSRKADNKGYIALHSSWENKIKDVPISINYNIDTVKLNSFRHFLYLAKKSGADVYVIYSPIFEKFSQSQEIEICSALCINEKVAFWDFSQDTTFLNYPSLFNDPNHLNHKGAVMFSKRIIDSLKYSYAQKIY